MRLWFIWRIWTDIRFSERDKGKHTPFHESLSRSFLCSGLIVRNDDFAGRDRPIAREIGSRVGDGVGSPFHGPTNRLNEVADVPMSA